MFDLEQSIAGWRQQMLDAGIDAPVPLDELETHLREENERQLQAGVGAAEAFQIAIQRIGVGTNLKAEFDKNNERRIMKHLIIIGAGVLGVLVGMALVLPAVAQYRQTGAMSHDEPWLFLIGSLLTLGGAGAAWAGAKRRHA
jgi:hypothetical protein